MSRSRPTGTGRRLCVLLLGFLVTYCTCLSSTPAEAGMLADTNHALTYTGPPTFNGTPWKGSVATARGTVEFAVFKPNKFADFLSENGIDPSEDPTDPSKGFIYAYQLLNPVGDITYLSIGETVNHDPSHVADMYPPSFYNPPGGNEQSPSGPVVPKDNGTSWNWSFQDPVSQSSGESSAILYFQAPLLPEWDHVTLYAGSPIFSAGANFSVPSISVIPEPSAVGLALVAAAGLLFRRRLRP